MFNLDTVRAAVTVGAGVAELLGGVIEHLRGKSAVDFRPALDEIERHVPHIVSAIRLGTAAAEEVDPATEAAAGDEYEDEAEDPAGDDTDPDAGQDEDPGEAGAEAVDEAELQEAGAEAEAESEASPEPATAARA